MRSRKKSNNKSITKKKPVKSSLTVHGLGKVFDKHVKHEFVAHDVEATMKTIVEEPYMHDVVTLKGGRGNKGVNDFYKNHFVGKMPSDTTVTRVSRTVGRDQVVDELIISFTHDREIDFMLPGIPAPGKFVQLPNIVVMKIKGNKIAHEHIYWDQGSLLDSNKVPVVGVEQAKVLIGLLGR